MQQNNFLKSAEKCQDNLRKGYSDAEISERMKSDPKVQEQMKEDFLRLQHKSYTGINPAGMVHSIFADGLNKDKKIDKYTPFRVIGGLGKRAMASYNLSKAKDYRSRKMSKLERQRLSEETDWNRKV